MKPFSILLPILCASCLALAAIAVPAGHATEDVKLRNSGDPPKQSTTSGPKGGTATPAPKALWSNTNLRGEMATKSHQAGPQNGAAEERVSGTYKRKLQWTCDKNGSGEGNAENGAVSPECNKGEKGKPEKLKNALGGKDPS